METLGLGHGFGPRGPDLDGYIEGSGHFAEKRSLFILRFGESDLNFRVKQDDRQAREAGTGAEVEKSGRVASEVLGGEEAFAKVTADDIFRTADSCEIGTGIPFEEKIEINGEFWVERVREGCFGEQIGLEKGGDRRVGEGGHRILSLSQWLNSRFQAITCRCST